jgi:glutamine synthetase
MFVGDVYTAEDLPEVPRTLREALTSFEQSEFAELTFGKEVHQHYIHFFRTEVEAYEAAVTDWELKRYFERI